MRRFVITSLALVSVTNFAHAQTDIASETVAGSQICFDEARQRLTAFSEDATWEWDVNRGIWGRLRVFPIGHISAAVYAPWEHRTFVSTPNFIHVFDGHAFETYAPMPVVGQQTRLLADTGSSELVALVQHSPSLTIEHYRFANGTWRPEPGLGAQRILMGEAYDPVRDVLVVDVMQLTPTAFQTFEWDGVTWTQRATNPTFHGRLAFDPGRQQVIGSRSSITWAWNGSTWTQLGVPGTPNVAGMTTDMTNGRVFARGTLNPSSADLWVLDGNGWRELVVSHPRVFQPQLSFDSQRERMVTYNGTEHAEFDGEAWHVITTGLPPVRSLFGQTYDSRRGQTIVFGGRDQNTNLLGETWAWDGQAWLQASSTGPSPRLHPMMTFDVVRGRVMLVSGTNGLVPPTYLQDHWEWNGVTWTLVQANTPFAAGPAALGYDRGRGRALHIDSAGDTREFDGTQWQLLGSGSVLPARSRLIWNGNTQHVQGTLRTGGFVAGEYEWDGANWNLTGPARGDAVYDTARTMLLNYHTDRLELTSPTPATAFEYGNACGGQTITTSLTAFGRPFPGTDQLTLDLRADATLRPALIGFATSQGNVPLGNGCTLLLQNPTASAIWFTDGNGVLQLPFPIPADSSLRGFVVDAQGVVLDPASPAGIALTQGLELTIGS